MTRRSWQRVVTFVRRRRALSVVYTSDGFRSYTCDHRRSADDLGKLMHTERPSRCKNNRVRRTGPSATADT